MDEESMSDNAAQSPREVARPAGRRDLFLLLANVRETGIIIFIILLVAAVSLRTPILNGLIAQKVNAIGVPANDPDALVPAGHKAIAAGIKFISWDWASRLPDAS
jgi:hypothetical protein